VRNAVSSTRLEHGRNMQTFQVLIVVAVAVAVVMVITWLALLWKRRQPLGSASRQRSLRSAREGLELLHTLQTQGARWPAIMAALNPGADDEIARLLLDLRGPHLFQPATALSVMADGFESALQANARASMADALRFARSSMHKVPRHGD